MRKVFKASAGTGKTYSLSLEYIAALLRGSKFNEILVMTFTKKATAEIRDRVLKFLETIAKGYFSKDTEEKNKAVELLNYIEKEYKTKVSEEQVKGLEDIYLEIISNKDQLEVHTIDGFVNKLFGKVVAKKKGILSYDMEEGNEVIEQILERIVSNSLYFKKFEEYFKGQRKRDIEDYSKLIESLIRNRWKYYLTGGHNPKKNMPSGESFFAVEELICDIKKFCEDNEKDIDKVFVTVSREYIQLESAEEKKNWLEENRASWINKNIWNGNQVKGKKNEAYKEHFTNQMEEIWEMLAKDIYNEEIIPFENLYFSLSEIVYKIYDEIRFSEKTFTFNDLSYYTLVAMLDDGYVKDKKLTDEFYRAYGTNFKTVFLDEFQDTSILQWKILHALVNSSKESIIVGDEKQSIYGWRDGEKKLFGNLPSIIDAEVKVLETCYRSHSNIIDFVNEYFNLTPEWAYEEVKSNKGEGYVEINIDKYGEESPIKLVERVYTETNYGSCGILARTNGQLQEIAAELEKLDIPYVLESKQAIYDYEACQPIYNLLKYLAYKDYFSLVKFLRVKPMNINGREFKTLIEMKNEILGYLEGVNKLEVDEALIKTLDTIKGIQEEKYYKHLGKKIIEGFPFHDAFGSESERKNINHFISLMNNFESLGEFLLWIEENEGAEQLKRVKTKEDNAVQLMTIHQSKGLEFETEYFYWVVNSQPPRATGIAYYLNLDKEYEKVEGYLVCDVKYRGILEYLGLDFAVKEELKRVDEEINNLYVALTRPEKNLICFYMDNAPRTDKFADEKAKIDPSPIDQALINYIPKDSLRECVGAPLVTGDYMVVNKRKETEKIMLTQGAENLFSFEDRLVVKKPISFENEYKRKDGLTLHHFMEFIYHGKAEEIEYARKQVYQKYSNMIGSRVEELIERAVDFIGREADKKGNRDSFLNDRWQVFNEFEINDGEKIKRIDRLMVDPEAMEAVIIDFKDSKDPEGKKAYQEQLKKYVELIEDRLPGYKISGELVEID